MIQTWECKKCDAAARTVDDALPHHSCPGMLGLMVPLTRVGARTQLIRVDREDYVGKEDVQRDGEGRAVMAVEVEHIDGSTDRTVYAPTAHLNARDSE